MQEVKIKFSDKEYDEISNLVKWLNTVNKYTKKDDDYIDYIVSDFIKGSARTSVENIKGFSFKHNVGETTKIKNNFKQIANERGVRQSEICDALGINKSNLSTIFNNRSQPNIELFFKIWAYLQCPPIHHCIYFED